MANLQKDKKLKCFNQLESIHKAIHSGGSDSSIAAAVLAKPSANDPTAYETAPLNKFSEFFAGTPSEKVISATLKYSIDANVLPIAIRRLL